MTLTRNCLAIGWGGGGLTNADESSEIVLTEANPHETSAAKKRGEKKPGFGDLFRSRSGKLGVSDQIEGDRLEESSEHVLHTGDPRERSLSMRSSNAGLHKLG